jgi:peptidoglycan hydrolase-like protein with peptidoglycan-binding domain
MQSLTSAVGHGKPNALADVLTVQRYLNDYLAEIIPLGPLREDGVFGAKTQAAILAFQKQGLRLRNPDGIIDPGGITFMTLAKQKRLLHGAPPQVESFLKLALPAARSVKSRWGVPIAVLLAQAAQETGWGKKVVDNAYFGIKGKSASGGSTAFQTTEVIDGKVVHMKDAFRAYTSFADAADDYGRFLKENARYAGCFQHSGDPIKFAQAVAAAGYATDPGYATALTGIIRGRGFDRYDR